MTSPTPLLEIQDLGRQFGNLWAVQGLSFSMERGKIYGFIGPNGSGKTTTMRIVATLDVPTTGDAYVNGVSVLREPREVRKHVGFMSDQFPPYLNLNVLEYLDFFARAYGLTGQERIDTVRSIAHFCGLRSFVDRPVTGLSKGMGQRVHLAKTLLHDPDLLVLDEPANGLDPRARIEFRDLLKELAVAGKGILISSHILSELSEICHGVLVLEQGRMVVSGDVAHIAQNAQPHRPIEVRVLDQAETAARWLQNQPHVQNLSTDGLRIKFDFGSDDAALAQLLRLMLHASPVPVVDFRQRETNLEEIFMHTTKGKLQ